MAYNLAEGHWKFVLWKLTGVTFPHSQDLRKGAMLCSHPHQLRPLGEQWVLSLQEVNRKCLTEKKAGTRDHKASQKLRYLKEFIDGEGTLN